MKKINIKEIVARLKECQKSSDTEAAHGTADNILCEILIDLGYKEVVEEWGKVDKWYA